MSLFHFFKTHHQSTQRSRRLWLIDRQAAAIATDIRDDLGAWLTRKFQYGVTRQNKKAVKVLKRSGHSVPFLARQWKLQRKAQLSIRARTFQSHLFFMIDIYSVDAPTRLKKELEQVIQLQTDIVALESTIARVKTVISATGAPREAHTVLASLQVNHDMLVKQSEELYTSLNIGEEFSSLEGLDIRFVRVLLLARDLKITLRKKAIASFFEWYRLDQSVGGAHQALGR